MCKTPQPPVPKSWTVSCLKNDGIDDGGVCSRFFSPDGMVFKTVEEVYKHNTVLEKERIEKEKKKIFSFASNGRFVEDKIPCGLCDKKFATEFKLKRHQEDVHKNPFIQKNDNRRRSVRLQRKTSTSPQQLNVPTSLRQSPPGPPQSPPGPPQSVAAPKKFNWTLEVADEKFSSLCHNKLGTEDREKNDLGPLKIPMWRTMSGMPFLCSSLPSPFLHYKKA